MPEGEVKNTVHAVWLCLDFKLSHIFHSYNVGIHYRIVYEY